VTVAIPLKKQAQYNELRYALRSLSLQYPYAEVVLIGPVIPEWVTNIRHIIHEDAKFHEWKSLNIYNKIQVALKDYERVLFMNDDHYLLSGVYYSHHKGLLTVEGRNPIGTYTKLLQNTIDALQTGAFDFDTHCPIWYDRDKFAALAALDWTKQHGYGIKSCYCGLNNIEGDYYPDLKFNGHIGDVTGRLYFSTEDTCHIKGLKDLFPNPCVYEK